jgi:SAM-dependent methyltransferase
MSRDDRERWESAHASQRPAQAPSPFLVEHVGLLPCGRTLDLAAGSGRHARFLAGRGHRVIAIDVARAALARLHAEDARVSCVQMDLDAPGIRPQSVDAVVVVSFLDRRLFPEVGRWLRPGGVLLWDTFLLEQRTIGHPHNPDFLLQPGELVERLRAGFEVLAAREGRVEEGGAPAFRSGVVARRRPDGA